MWPLSSARAELALEDGDPAGGIDHPAGLDGEFLLAVLALAHDRHDVRIGVDVDALDERSAEDLDAGLAAAPPAGSSPKRPRSS